MNSHHLRPATTRHSLACRRPLFAAGIFVLLAACGGGSDDKGGVTDPPPQPVVTSVAVSPSSAVLTIGADRQLSATASGSSGPITGRATTWSSSAAAVASVSNTGLVHAVAAGTATISATIDGKSGDATIQVQNPAPVLATIEPATTVATGDAITIVATGSAFLPTSVIEWDGFARTTVWNSATQLTATLNAGDVASVGEHTVHVRTPAPGGGLSSPRTFTVTPVPVASVTLTPTQGTLVPGQELTLAATARDAAGNELSGRTIAFSTDNASIATVTTNATSGVVYAVAAGTTTITATSEGESASAAITVRPGGMVGAAGGTLTNDHVTLNVPAGAVAVPTAFTIETLDAPPPSAALVAGSAMQLGPPGVAFAQPVNVTMRWTAAQESGADPSRFAVHRWDGQQWIMLPNADVDVAARTAQGTTTAFSPFALLELPPPPGLAATEIVFSNANSLTLEVIDVETKQRRSLGVTGVNPAISQDRDLIAFERDLPGRRQIFMVNHDGSEERRLTNGSLDDTRPNFHPNGTRVFFARYDLSTRRIASTDTSGGGVIVHTDGEHVSDDYPAVAPSGSALVMTRSQQ